MNPLQIALDVHMETVAELSARLTNSALTIVQLQEENAALKERVKELEKPL